MNYDLLHPLVRHPRRVPVTEEACEQRTCPCWKRGFQAGARAERQRQEMEEHGLRLLPRLLAGAVFLVLFALWLAGRG